MRTAYENQNFLNFDLLFQYNLLETFFHKVSSNAINPLNLGDIRRFVNENPDEISGVLDHLQLVLQFFQSRLYPAQYNPESVSLIIDQLNSWLLLGDEELFELLKKITHILYAEKGVISSTSTSYRDTPLPSSENLLFHSGISENELYAVMKNLTKHVIFAPADKTMRILAPIAPKSQKGYWYLGTQGVFNGTFYFENNKAVSSTMNAMEFFDCCVTECVDFPFNHVLTSLLKFKQPSEDPAGVLSIRTKLSPIKNSVSSTVKKLVTKTPHPTLHTFEEWKNVDQLIMKSKENNSILFNKNQKLLSDIRLKINWSYFGLQQYIAIMNISSPSFTIKNKEYDTKRTLLFPGIRSIHSTTNSMILNKYILEYIFPYENPNPTIFNYLRKRKCIQDLRLLKVRKYHWHTNVMEYVDSSIINTGFGFLTQLVKKIYTDEKYQFPIRTFQQEFAKVDSFLSPDDNATQQVKRLYQKNLRKYSEDRRTAYLREISSPMYWIEPNMLHFYSFPLRAGVFLSPLDSNQKNLFIRIFSLFPYCRIYECVDYTNPTRECMYADLFFFESHIDQIYFLLKELATLENISEFNFIPNVVPLTYYDFAKINEYYIPSVFEAHSWNSRSKRYQTLKYFDEEGKPIDLVDLHAKK